MLPLIDDAVLRPLERLTKAQNQDYLKACDFLLMYKDNDWTFIAYRREVERFLQWCFLKEKKLAEIQRAHFEVYIKFCLNPPKDWITTKKTSRFLTQNNTRIPNPEWKPFTSARLLPKSLREIFVVCSSLFSFLIQENYIGYNPVIQIRQKSKYFIKRQSQRVVRKLSELQWGYVIETAYLMTVEDPKYERTLFIMSALYSMYLRISELASSDRWTPEMGDFTKDNDGHWWFTTIGKGNKERQIAVSKEMLNSLKRWRTHLKMSPLPLLGDTNPLVPKLLGRGPITSTRPIRRIVQYCFERAMKRLIEDNHTEAALQLKQATVHWLRHTGISEDVKSRPKEHVRDDAGHSSSSVTDQYIDVEFHERNTSAQNKRILPK